jgi:hypothetical protein
MNWTAAKYIHHALHLRTRWKSKGGNTKRKNKHSRIGCGGLQLQLAALHSK